MNSSNTGAQPPLLDPTQDASILSTSVPSLSRRMAAFLYEGVLLFGVLMISGWLYSGLTQMRDARIGTLGLQLFLLLTLAVYFCWFWVHGGQTVAMRAWHVRVVDQLGRPLTQGRALARFAASWLWFLPALLMLLLSGQHGGGIISAALLAGVAGYAALTRLHPQRQFLHDALCGTRLITWRPVKPVKT